MSIAGKSRSQRRRAGGPPFVQLYRFIKRSQAYHDLSLPARCALIELMDRYTGINNGMIGLGARELANELKCSKDTASRALRELDDSGLVRPMKVGVWRGKRATTWRLSFYRCDLTGDLPNKSWHARSQYDQKDAKVRPEGHKPTLSPTRRTHEPKNPINGNPLSPTSGTHIDIYHGDTDLPARASDVDVADTLQTDFPDLPSFLNRRRPAPP
jgi:hypothetical protein